MKTYNGLDVYEGFVNDDEAGMFCISLVDMPATEADFLYFNKDKQPLLFSVEDREKRIVRGLLMGAGQMIYRRNGDYEYYITYSADTLRLMAEKYLKNGFSSNVDLNHDGVPVEGINMTQIFIKDTEAGINPKGFEDYNDGSLFVEFKVNNDEVWEQIKDGDFKGFSLAGFFEIRETFNKQIRKNTLQMKLGKLKIALQKILAETFAQVSTTKGILAWDSDSELPEVGASVYSFDEEGNQISVEDGEYGLDDGTVIVVADGKVKEIRDPEKADSETPTDETPADEGGDEGGDDNVKPVEEDADESAEGESDAERIANLEAEIARLEEENGALRERIAELEGKPAAQPAEEEFKRVNKIESTGNKRLDNLARILNA